MGIRDRYLTDYVEAPYVIKRNGIYYLLYSSGALHDGTYSVHYAMSDNPLGPFITPENNCLLYTSYQYGSFLLFFYLINPIHLLFFHQLFFQQYYHKEFLYFH